MRTSMTDQSLAIEIKRQHDTARDFLPRPDQMGFDDDNNFVIGEHGSFAPTRLFDQQIATHVKYPFDFYTRSRQEHPAQWRDLMTAMLHSTDKKRFVRTLDGTARAFLSDRYRRIDNYDVAKVALEMIGTTQGWSIVSADLTPDRMYIKALSPRQVEVSKGDIVQGGFVISNSETGLGSVRVEPLIYRLVCTNGMIAQDNSIRRNHVGSMLTSGDESSNALFTERTLAVTDHALFLQIGDVLRASVDEAKLRLMAESLRETTTRKIEQNAEVAIEVFAKHVGLTETERCSVFEHLIAGNELKEYGMSQYTLLNAVTATAQDADLTYQRATELERLGGEVAIMHTQPVWKQIASKN